MFGHENDGDVIAHYEQAERVIDELINISKTTVNNAQTACSEAITRLTSVKGYSEYLEGCLPKAITADAYDELFSNISYKILYIGAELSDKIDSIRYYENASLGEKVFSTTAMVGAKTTEGVLSIGEFFGDCAVLACGWICGLFGNESFKQDCYEFANRDLSNEALSFYYDSDFAKASAFTEDSLTSKIIETAASLGFSNFTSPLNPVSLEANGILQSLPDWHASDRDNSDLEVERVPLPEPEPDPEPTPTTGEQAPTPVPTTAGPTPTPTTASPEPTTVPTAPPTIPTEPAPPTQPTEPIPTEPTVPTAPAEPTVPTSPTPVPTTAPTTPPTQPTQPTAPSAPPQTQPTAPSGPGYNSGGQYDENGYTGGESDLTTAFGTNLQDLMDDSAETVDQVIKGSKFARIPTTPTPITTATQMGGSNIIPIASGLSVAAAAGVGAKAYMDHKRNQSTSEEEVSDYEDEEDDIEVDNWSDDNQSEEYDETYTVNRDRQTDEEYYDNSESDYTIRQPEELEEL